MMLPVVNVSVYFDFFFYFPPVTCLQCYDCFSKTSWQDCKDKSSKCTGLANERCINVYVKNGDVETFSKGFDSKEYCDKDLNPTCRLHKRLDPGSKFDISCCNTNLCNAGSVTGISGIALVAGAIVLLAFQA